MFYRFSQYARRLLHTLYVLRRMRHVALSTMPDWHTASVLHHETGRSILELVDIPAQERPAVEIPAVE
jgi:hypothetical protein